MTLGFPNKIGISSLFTNTKQWRSITLIIIMKYYNYNNYIKVNIDKSHLLMSRNKSIANIDINASSLKIYINSSG